MDCSHAHVPVVGSGAEALERQARDVCRNPNRAGGHDRVMLRRAKLGAVGLAEAGARRRRRRQLRARGRRRTDWHRREVLSSADQRDV